MSHNYPSEQKYLPEQEVTGLGSLRHLLNKRLKFDHNERIAPTYLPKPG
jgi:hypothetical protein